MDSSALTPELVSSKELLKRGNTASGRAINSFTRHSVENLANNYKLTPATLYSKLDPSWIPKPFLLQASLKIAQTIVKPDGRLIISWPPRHGKSRLATIATPIWCLENFPDKDIILSTYGADLSTDFGREVRDIFSRNQHLLGERIRKDVKATGRFKTEKDGGMLSVGLGGAITGKGADVFLIDDYIKTMKEAQSTAKHEDDWEWFTGTAYHRLEPGGSMIIIATRWHPRDLIGRILREFPDEWEHVKFHAEAKENDILGRQVGEPLFPERFPKHRLADRKKVLGTFFYNALYQQEPEDDESRLTNPDWIEVIDELPRGIRFAWARVWDFAATKGGGDYSVGTLVAVDQHTRIMYITDVWRKQATPETTESKVRNLALNDGQDCKIYIEQEPGASGVQLVSHYELNVLPSYKVEGSPATTNKIVRAQPFLAAAEGGRIKILRGKWNTDFLKEFEDFPHGDNDDQIDTCSIGYNKLLPDKPKKVTWGRPVKQIQTPHGAPLVRGASWGSRR